MKRQSLKLFYILILFTNSIYSQIFFDFQIKHTFRKTLTHWTWMPEKEISTLKQGDSISLTSKLFETKIRHAFDSTLSMSMNYERLGEIRFYRHKQIQKYTQKRIWEGIGKWSINNSSDLLIYIDNKEIYLERRDSYNEFMDFIVKSVRKVSTLNKK